MKWIKQKVIGFLGRSKDEQREKKTTHPARDSCNPRSNERETNANSSELRVDIRLHSIASNLDRSHDAHRGQSRFFLLPDAASLPHTERGAVTRTSLNAREREKKSALEIKRFQVLLRGKKKSNVFYVGFRVFDTNESTWH